MFSAPELCDIHIKISLDTISSTDLVGYRVY